MRKNKTVYIEEELLEKIRVQPSGWFNDWLEEQLTLYFSGKKLEVLEEKVTIYDKELAKARERAKREEERERLRKRVLYATLGLKKKETKVTEVTDIPILSPIK